jgi:hypothetical protein
MLSSIAGKVLMRTAFLNFLAALISERKYFSHFSRMVSLCLMIALPTSESLSMSGIIFVVEIMTSRIYIL